MTHRMLFIGAMCLTTLLLITCSDRHNPVGPLPPIEIDQFPMTEGTRWLYSVEDTIQGLIDTIEVEIARVADTSSDQLATIWHYHSRNHQIATADAFVTVLADTVFFQDERTRDTYLKLVFPIFEGASWMYRQARGEYFTGVEGELQTKVPAGKFKAFKVRTALNPYALSFIQESRSWLVPGVGFVRNEHILGTLVITQYQVWELISYTPSS